MESRGIPRMRARIPPGRGCDCALGLRSGGGRLRPRTEPLACRFREKKEKARLSLLFCLDYIAAQCTGNGDAGELNGLPAVRSGRAVTRG